MPKRRKDSIQKLPDSTASGRPFTHKLGRTGRRGFMKLLSKLGISSAAVATLSKGTLAEKTGDPREEVPIVEVYKHTNHQEILDERAPPEREPQYDTIARDRWVIQKGARNARYEVAKRFEDHPRVSVGIEYDDPGKNPRPQITVNLNKTAKSRPGNAGEAGPPEIVDTPSISKEAARSRVPTSVVATVGERGFERETDPIPVTVAENVRVEQASFDEEYRPVRAGVACDVGWNGPKGSIAHAAYSDDVGAWGWATAGHVVEWDTGTRMDQPDARIGESAGPILGTEDGYYNRDAAFVREDNPPYAGYGIGDEGGGRRDFDVFGSVAEDKLHELESKENADIYFQGPMSGKWSSNIQGLEGDGSISYDTRVVELTEPSSSNGDSGCTYYWKKDPDTAYIVGVHAWGRDPDEEGFVEYPEGNTMEYVEGALNLSI